ncbi:hypothetical protein [Streptomyces sp. KL116D]|uniref:hypothetical protein n=1 Tax=Streptomyces sp. KL116D TaxID=3045152 RepID=UPI003556AE3F
MQAQRRLPATAATCPATRSPRPGTPDRVRHHRHLGEVSSWPAATDDKGIKNYDVLRDGAKVATVTGHHVHTDTSGRPRGTDYSYTVQARDTADQTGPPPARSRSTPLAAAPTPGNPGTGDKVKLGYFTDWGVYGRQYFPKNLETSGPAAKVTHINYCLRQRPGRQVHDGRHLRRRRTWPTPRRPTRLRRRRHLGPGTARQRSTSSAS